MIIVRLTGGLGNQMFQYAFGRNLAIRNSTELKLDTSLLAGNKKTVVQSQPVYSLDMFNISADFATEEEVVRLNGSPGRHIFMKLHNRWRMIFNPYRNVVQKNHLFKEEHLRISNNFSISGRWQSEKYFSEIKDIIRKDFIFKEPLDDYSAGIAESIMMGNSISVHIRRGDYLLDSHFSKVLGVLSDKYYNTAIGKIENSVINPKYYIFSDDIPCCKSKFDYLGSQVVYVEQIDSNRATELDLHLMTLCNGHIISNSTYAWWGAWLSDAAGKIVITPEVWAVDRNYSPPHIIPEDWVTISPC